MPIRWTPETDQLLLLKILETSNVNADVKAISAAWPTNQEVPTPRAISERLVKIRSMAKESGIGAKFNISNGKTSAPTTPRKKVAKEAQTKKPSGVKKQKTGTKRKRGGKVEMNSTSSSAEESGADSTGNENAQQTLDCVQDNNRPIGEV